MFLLPPLALHRFLCIFFLLLQSMAIAIYSILSPSHLNKFYLNMWNKYFLFCFANINLAIPNFFSRASFIIPSIRSAFQSFALSPTLCRIKGSLSLFSLYPIQIFPFIFLNLFCIHSPYHICNYISPFIPNLSLFRFSPDHPSLHLHLSTYCVLVTPFYKLVPTRGSIALRYEMPHVIADKLHRFRVNLNTRRT